MNELRVRVGNCGPLDDTSLARGKSDPDLEVPTGRHDPVKRNLIEKRTIRGEAGKHRGRPERVRHPRKYKEG